jgi:hypothetical protein
MEFLHRKNEPQSFKIYLCETLRLKKRLKKSRIQLRNSYTLYFLSHYRFF